MRSLLVASMMALGILRLRGGTEGFGGRQPQGPFRPHHDVAKSIMSEPTLVYLFSYGTLQNEAVQLSSFGRRLAGALDAMPGYRQSLVEITDPAVLATSGERFHPIVEPSSNPADEVAGTVFQVTPAELAAADAYEVADYARVSVRLKSGIEAWVYVRA
jgi:hypothetical protein